MLSKLSKNDKDRFKSGDLKFIQEKIKEELEETKENLILFPIDQLQELRGKAKILATILNLLG